MNTSSQQKSKNSNQLKTILVIDDSPTNLEVLYETLSYAGYEVLVEMDGLSGIEQVNHNPPDLILLDVMMPKIDGFETCRQLQANPATKDIPIIFITALTEAEEKLKGLTLGAVDYITKPFQQEEVIARIQLHLKLRYLNLELTLQKQQLEQRVKERTAELSQTLEELKRTQVKLIQSEKTSALGQIVAGVSHEVNNPVGLISTNLYYANQYIQDLIDLVKIYQNKFPNVGVEISEKIEHMDLAHIIQDLPKLLSSMKLGTDNIRGIIQSLQNFSRVDGTEKKYADIHEGIETTLMILQYRIKAQTKRPPIKVIKEYGNLPKIECYPGQLNQVFMYLLNYAIDGLEKSYISSNYPLINKLEFGKDTLPQLLNLQIKIITDVNKENVIIKIVNNALDFSDSSPDGIKEYFIPNSFSHEENDLGFSVSKQLIVENHSGSLECIYSAEIGKQFVIKIPLTNIY